VTASADTTARVWDAGNGQPLTDPFKHLLPVIEAQFSPDGRQIATIAGQAAMVWDMAPAQPEYPYWLLTLSEAISGQVLNKRARVHRKSNQRKHPGLP
jgi:WD40 repeat protein